MDESEIISGLADRLITSNWHVVDQAGDQVDLIVSAPTGKMFAIELSVGEGPAHFASLGHIDRVAHYLSDLEGQSVTPVLVTTEDLSPSIEDVATQVGVELLHVSQAAISTQSSLDEFSRSLIGMLLPNEDA